MIIGEIIERKYCGDKFYLVVDETDPLHETEIGSCFSIEEAIELNRVHSKSFPDSTVSVYEMVREDY